MMSLRKPTDPKELRTALHAFYEPYAQGVVDFPKVRISWRDSLPERTKPIAQALIGAWEQIDYDRATHNVLIDNVLKNRNKMLRTPSGEPARGVILCGIGRNVLMETVIAPVEDKIAIVSTPISGRDAIEEYLESASLELYDGRVITGGGFDGAQTPDVKFPVPAPGGRVRQIAHFVALDTRAA